jgi:hypothetical protein
VFMPRGSPAEVIPFTRFLECRQRLRRIAPANGTVVTPESTDVGIRPEVTGPSNDDDGASPRGAAATVHAAVSRDGLRIV